MTGRALALSIIGGGFVTGLALWALNGGGGNALPPAEREDLRARLANDTSIPFRSRRWLDHVLAATNATLPSGVDAEEWARVLLAIIERESGGGDGLSPPGPSGVGDGGHGRGLMQLDDRTFGAWLAAHDWMDPGTNILQGATVLRDNYKQAVKLDSAYEPLFTAISGYNAGFSRVRSALANGMSPDSVTTNNYASGVWALAFA